MVIGEVDIGEDSFRVKLSCKRIGERGLVAWASINEAMHAKGFVRGESIEDERTIEGLKGGIRGKEIVRGIRVVVIGEVEIGEDSF